MDNIVSSSFFFLPGKFSALFLEAMAVPYWLRANNPTGVRPAIQVKRKALSFSSPGVTNDAEIVLGDDSSRAKKAKLTINDSGVTCVEFSANEIKADNLEIKNLEADSLTIDQNASIGGNLNVVGNISSAGNIGANGDIACDNLTVSNDGEVGHDFKVTHDFNCFGDASLHNLNVDNISELAGPVEATDSFTSTGGFSVYGSFLASGTQEFTGGSSIFQHPALFNDVATFEAEVTFNDNVNLNGTTYFMNLLGIPNGLGGSITVQSGDIATLFVENDLYVYGTLHVNDPPVGMYTGGLMGGQIVPGGVLTPLNIISDNEVMLGGGMTYNGQKFIVPVTGFYHIEYSISWTYHSIPELFSIDHGILHNDTGDLLGKATFIVGIVDSPSIQSASGSVTLFLVGSDSVEIAVNVQSIGDTKFCDADATNMFTCLLLYGN